MYANNAGETGGEDYIPPSDPMDGGKAEMEKEKARKEALELKILQNMCKYVTDYEEGAETDKTKIALVWRAMQITRKITPYPDETVPPPPIPETPMPEIEDEGEGEEEAEKKPSMDEDEKIRLAKLEAKTHALGEIYTGSGVCQLPLAKIRWPDDFIPPRTFSKITVSTLEEFKTIMESIAPQLEPLDIQAIIAENLWAIQLPT